MICVCFVYRDYTFTLRSTARVTLSTLAGVAAISDVTHSIDITWTVINALINICGSMHKATEWVLAFMDYSVARYA